MAERELLDGVAGEPPSHEAVQQLVEAESGRGAQGIRRVWQAADSDLVVLTSTAAGVKISRDAGVTAPAQVIVDGTAAGGALAGTYPSPTLAPATLDALIPPGTVWPYAGAAPPLGWLLCDGTPQSRTGYPELFAAIGTAYGAGDTVTTFNLPDLRGRVVLGVSGTHPRGDAGGAETGPAHLHPGSHSHGLASHAHNIPAHAHTLSAHTHTLNGHSHGSTSLSVSGSVGAAVDTPVRVTPLGSGGQSVSSDNHTHDDSFDVSGSTDGSSVASAVPSTPDTSTAPLVSSDIPAPATTATDNAAHGSSYGDAEANLPPFTALQYMIRTGA